MTNTELIRQEIDKILEKAEKDEKKAFMKKDAAAHLVAVTKTAVAGKIKNFIDSLQQEQPDGLRFTPLNRLIQKIPSKKWNDNTNNYAKNLRDCLIKEGYLKDAKVLQDYISYMNGNNIPMATMDEQEQPEHNIEEKAISLQIQAYLTTASDELYAPGKPLYTKSHHKNIHDCMLMWQKLHQYYFSAKQEQPEVDLEKEVDRFLKSEESTTYENAGSYKVAVKDPKKIARHFYELGLKARKEE